MPNETIDFPEFLSVMTRKLKVKDTEKELVGILKSSTVMKRSHQRCRVMPSGTCMSEKPTNEEVDEMIQSQIVQGRL